MSARARKHSLIYETVLEYIKADLLQGNLQPGDRLPTVASLAQQLNVGLASVREAYRVLENMGILEVTQGRGTFVSARLSQGTGVLEQFQLAEQQTLEHLLEARKLIEPAVADLAAERATEAEARAILNAATKMEELARADKDFIDPDVAFDELIFVAAHNPVLANLLSALNHLLLDSRRLSSRLPGATEKATHYHKLIAHAIMDGNADGARNLMYQHLADVESDLAKA
jgi:GntR family transcriptional repressor for pyruvate dehydrogenase complex